MILRIAAKIIALTTLILITAPWAWQMITGDYFMKVTGTSMEPTYNVGDTLVVQKPTGHDLTHVGQIVVVSFEPGDQQHQYVHRVHTINERGALLQGDNNADVDPGYVTEKLVMGTPRYHLAGALSQAYQLSQTWPIRLLAAAIIIPGLALRIRPQRRTANPNETAPQAPKYTPRHARARRATPRDDANQTAADILNDVLGDEDAPLTLQGEPA